MSEKTRPASQTALTFALLTAWLALSSSASATDPLNELALPENGRFAFTETSANALLRKPRSRSGQLWRDGDTLIMAFSEPRWEQRHLSQSRATLIRQRPVSGPGGPKTQRLSMQLDAGKPAHVLLMALSGALMGDAEALKQHLELGERSDSAVSNASWQLPLKPKALVKGLCGVTLHGRQPAPQAAANPTDPDTLPPIVQVDVDQCDGAWQQIRIAEAVLEAAPGSTNR